ncbi:hypothetical protein [Aestuariivirga sp.]|jgi:hypothetical protein|uniref:hypothetical protein n=1 Tax=Aestuariivirga sp. TaxID=2650926 RepID=UPI0037841516
MPNVIRIKRRASGNAGAPAALKSAELAHNEVDNTLYVGKGDDGSGNATSIVALAGVGAFADLSTTQTVGGAKTFSIVPKSSQDASASTDLVRKSQFDTALTGKASTTHSHAIGEVTGLQTALDGKAAASHSHVIGDVTGLQTALDGKAASSHVHAIADVSGLQTALDAKAPLVSPALTGTPTAPTAASGTNTTQLATTAFVLGTRLDQLAQPTADVPLNSRKITGLGDPVSSQDAATKNYVDLAVQGLDPKQSVRAASTANIATLSGTMTIDGVALVAEDRVLVKDQTSSAQNGVYVVAASTWARAADMDAWGELVSAYLFVEQGTVNADMGFLCTVDPGGTLGTTSVSFVQFSGAGQIVAGAGLTRTGNTLDVVTASSARIVVNADSIDLATTGVGAGTYRSVTVDTYGRVTGGTNPTTLSGYGITDAQSLDATLTALAGLATAADRLPYATGIDTFALATFTAFGRSLVDDADAATGRATLGLGTMATQAANNVSITGGTLDGVTIDGGTF